MTKIEMAINSAKNAINNLEYAEIELEKARKYGIADLLGGGVIIGLVKRSKMGNAEEYINEAEKSLKAFKENFENLSLEDINIDSRDLYANLDVFLDGIFSGFVVQKRINEALDAVRSAIIEIENVIEKLEEIK